MFYIYILYSESADKFYIGYTQNPAERLMQHNHQENFNAFTRKSCPWKMKALFEATNDKTTAIKIERFKKKQTSKALLEKLCKEETTPSGILAQLVRVPNIRD